MVLTSARTGSTLLLSLLGAHSRIKTYGELFNLETLPSEHLREVLEDPIAYLSRRVHKSHGPSISAVGFKMFYDHLTRAYFQKPISVSETCPRLQEVFGRSTRFIESAYSWDVLDKRFRSTWEYLRADRSLAVIHLRRHNVLHTLVSLKLAFVTNRWWSLTSSPEHVRTIRLEPDECVRYFRKLDSLAAEADVAFHEHQKIDVTYEDLTQRQDDTLQQVFRFLMVPYEPVRTRLKKQNVASPRETVDNYDELKSYFCNTRWASCFE